MRAEKKLPAILHQPDIDHKRLAICSQGSAFQFAEVQGKVVRGGIA
jgi:hypothetical protein